jgi:uncharacterized protein (TIGR02145 family)
MINNLKLGSTTGTTTLYGGDTNLGTGLHTTTATLPQVGETTTFDNDTPRAYGPVPGIPVRPPSNDITSETFYGYLYNWCAAKAGSAQSCVPVNTYPTPSDIDICPVNWHMPRGGDYDDSNNEFAQLTAAMAGESFADYVNNFAYSDPTYVDGLNFNGPFKGVLSGMRSGTQGIYQDIYGADWAGSLYPSDPSFAFYLSFTPGMAGPGSRTAREYGMAVRCVL